MPANIEDIFELIDTPNKIVNKYIDDYKKI